MLRAQEVGGVNYFELRFSCLQTTQDDAQFLAWVFQLAPLEGYKDSQ